MLSYSVNVSICPACRSVSSDAVPDPPPVDVQVVFRSLCLTFYSAAVVAGDDHLRALRTTAAKLKAMDHPWHSFEVVQHVVNSALGRRRGRPCKGVSHGV